MHSTEAENCYKNSIVECSGQTPYTQTRRGGKIGSGWWKCFCQTQGTIFFIVWFKWMDIGPDHIMAYSWHCVRLLQYNRGRRVDTRWVLGIACCEYKPARLILQYVQNRSKEELLPFIHYYVKAGTTVHTDCWRAYEGLSNVYDHQTVNHSRYFVHPTTG